MKVGGVGLGPGVSSALGEGETLMSVTQCHGCVSGTLRRVFESSGGRGGREVAHRCLG